MNKQADIQRNLELLTELIIKIRFLCILNKKVIIHNPINN